jgi:hypothetical protein
MPEIRNLQNAPLCVGKKFGNQKRAINKTTEATCNEAIAVFLTFMH